VTQDRPSAEQNSGTDNRRRGKSGEILQHNATSNHGQQRSTATGTGIRGDLTRLVNCPQQALYPPFPAH